MPYKKSTKSLRKLCLKVLTANFRLLKSQISLLPHVLINDLYCKISKPELNLQIPSSKIFLNINTPRLERHNFQGPTYSQQDVEKRINKIIHVCKNVKHIDLINVNQSLFDSISAHAQLTQLISPLQRLVLIRVCNDRILSAIATHCSQLRHLDLRHSKNVTDNGINFFRIKQNLKIEYFNIVSTNTTLSGCLHILNNLPVLKIFKHSHWEDLYQFLTENFNSGQISNTYKLEALEKVSNEQVFNMAAVLFPNLNYINININISINRILTHNYLEKLTTLIILNTKNIDVRLIGHYCPLIIEFHLHIIGNDLKQPVSFEKTKHHRPFKYLRKLFINGSGNVTREELLMLLTNCYLLDELGICNCDNLRDDLILEITKLNQFSQLQTLYFDLCNFISTKSIKVLLEMNNPLRFVFLMNCSLFYTDIARLELKNYIEKENLNVNLETGPYFTGIL